MKVEIKPSETALLIVDMQNDFVSKGGFTAKHGSSLWKIVQEDLVIENILKAREVARRCRMPIFFVKHVYRRDLSDADERISDYTLQHPHSWKVNESPVIEGSWGSEVIKQLQPEETDYVVSKKRSSAFYNTDLELLLRCRGIKTLIITGIATDHCVESTIRSATDRDFNVVVLTDCTATEPKEIHDYWIKNVFPKRAVTMKTAEFTEMSPS